MLYKEILDYKILVSYLPSLDYNIVNSHNLDFIKVASKKTPAINTTFIAISAAITAYAGIYITKLKLNIIKTGGVL